MKNSHRSKSGSREVSKRKQALRKPTAASVARRYAELQLLRQRLTLAQAAQSSIS